MQEKLAKAVSVINGGGVCILPSDTCYMLAVDATNQKAVDKLLQLKSGLVGKPISVVVDSLIMAKEYCQVNTRQEISLKNLFPGPYTVVLPAKKQLALGVVSLQNTLGIRIPKNKFLIDLVKTLGRPITATSALLYGDSIPYSLGFLNKLSKKKRDSIDWIFKAGKLPKNNLSTLVNMVEGTVLERKSLLENSRLRKISRSVWETGEIASKVLKRTLKGHKRGGVVFLLTGELGGGKTTFVKFIGEKLGVKEIITSPTFSIFDSYEVEKFGFKKFIHADLYRLNGKEDLDNIKFSDWFSFETIACIEWPEKMEAVTLEVLKQKMKVVTVGFEYKGQNSRIISY